jgi:HK97 family phage major capsid protein
MELEDLNSLRTVEELTDYRALIDARTAELDKEFAGLPMSAEATTEWDALKTQRVEVDARITELNARREYIEGLAGDESRHERVGTDTRPSALRGGSRLPDNVFELAAYRQLARSDGDYSSLLTDGARKAIDGAVYPHPNAEEDKVKADLTKLFDTVDDPDALARHILATGSPSYGQAFGKALRSGGANLNSVELAALTLGTDNAGGAAVPFQLDPTLILTSDGVINPLRDGMARIERIVGKAWQGVTTAGVTATRGTEVAEAADADPNDLANPEVATNRVDVFIPLSIELELAWGAVQAQLAPVIQDAKDTEEAGSFVTGDGTTGTQPDGIVGALAATSLVFTGDASMGPEDVYALKNATPPRFRARGQFLGESSIYDEVRQFDENGGSNMWVQLEEGRPGGLIGYRAREISTMDSVVENDADILVFGDFRQFLIVDRIGMRMEIIPHLFGASRRPTGQRGIFAYWFNNSKILVDNAFRLLRVGVEPS